jgi:hypothetical protein
MPELEPVDDVATSVAQVDAMTPHERTARRARVVDDIARLKGFPRLTTSQRAQLDAFEEEFASLVTADAEEEIERSRRRGDLVRRAASPGNLEHARIDDVSVRTPEIPRNPLAFTSEALDAIQDAISNRTEGRFDGRDTRYRATLTTSTYGAPRAWGANVITGPRLLHVVAGVPQQPTSAISAQIPNLTLPAASASVGEGVSVAEYAASTAGAVSIARFGRYTDLSRESLIGTDAGAIGSMHQIGIAKDLDAVLINAVESAAGTAVAFTTDVPAAIRKALAQVADNTAAADATSLVVLVNPNQAALLQNVTPTGGQTIAEGFFRFSGALAYASSAVDDGFMTVANLQAGARYFEAQSLLTETDLAPKTGVMSVVTSVIAGYGLQLVGGAAGAFIKVDVVTP